MARLKQERTECASPLIGGAIGVGGQSPVGREILAPEEADRDLRVADIERQEHIRFQSMGQGTSNAEAQRRRVQQWLFLCGSAPLRFAVY
jgi:hypothetical protein